MAPCPFENLGRTLNMPLRYLAPLPLPHLSLLSHDLHVVLIFCSILPNNLPRQPVSHSYVGLPLASYYQFVHATLFPVLYIQYFTIRSVEIMLGLSLNKVLTCVLSQKIEHVARTILTRKRVRLRVRERVAFPYTCAVDVVNS